VSRRLDSQMLTSAVTDMLIAILNCCTKEELEEEEETPMITPETPEIDGMCQNLYWH
jgi:hypothetical protein